MVKLYGRELTFSERRKHKVYGIGFFKPVPDQPDILSRWFHLKNFTVRPHLDQLTDGMIFRLTGTKEMDALAIAYSEIKRIELKRLPDEINPIPLTPFWILMKLGFQAGDVRWFAFIWLYEFRFGELEVTIEVKEHHSIRLIWNARHERAVNKFFGSKFLKEKVTAHSSRK